MRHYNSSGECSGLDVSGNTGSSVWREKYLVLSAASTLVMCWKQHGCEMWDFSGSGWYCCFLVFLLRAPGSDRLIFSGHAVKRSIWDHISLAAFTQSKLSPISFVWSDDKHMVWNAWPDTLYDVRLSIVSCHKVKHVPRSAKSIWIRRLFLDRVSPVSNRTTGTPV